MDFIEFLKSKKEQGKRGSPETVLKHLGTWRFEKGELDNILEDIQTLREIEKGFREIWSLFKETDKRLESFKKFFPEYKGLKVVGAVGGIVIEEESDKYAYKNGLFVIGESGETVIILNDTKFRPKVW